MTPRKQSHDENGNNGNGRYRGQWVWNLLSGVSIVGLIGAGIAWGSLSKQVEVNTPRIARLEAGREAEIRQLERQDEMIKNLTESMRVLREENNKSHDRIEKSLNRIYGDKGGTGLAKSDDFMP